MPSVKTINNSLIHFLYTAYSFINNPPHIPPANIFMFMEPGHAFRCF